jgi:hypothetical protein
MIYMYKCIYCINIFRYLCIMYINMRIIGMSYAFTRDAPSSTMTFTFDRPVGAAADVTELDYISALHQTDVINGIRKDGSIEGKCRKITSRVCALFGVF